MGHKREWFSVAVNLCLLRRLPNSVEMAPMCGIWNVSIIFGRNKRKVHARCARDERVTYRLRNSQISFIRRHGHPNGKRICREQWIGGNEQKGVAPEMQLSLAFCQAPRVSRSSEGVEEYFGWDSREYLRKMVIGQVVKFKVLYKVDVINRTFGVIEMKDKDVVREMVSSGYVSVRSERDEKNNKELLEDLLALQEEARENRRGIWSPTKTLRSVIWTVEDPESFFQAHKGLPTAAVVEQFRDGSTMKLYLLETHEMITMRLAGVQCPRITYSAEGKGRFAVIHRT